MSEIDVRRSAYETASTALALCGDRELRELVDAAQPLGSGIGGRSALLEVSGVPVFVKRVPLTDLELRPEHLRSTANVFEVPAFCHYALGGPGFGAWRELAVHTMTTNWALAGQHEGFPLTYHWRVLPDGPHPLHHELADVEKVVAFWGGGPGVRRRLEALQRSSASLTLFQEYLPQTLHEWFTAQVQAGGETADRACALVEAELEAGVSFMNDRGLLHFDTHFRNILTDGRRLYFADYGLALSSRFDLSRAEAEFLTTHRTFDRCYTASFLVQWLVTALYGHGREERVALIRDCADGKPLPEGTPPRAAAILTRHAPTAAVMLDFFDELFEESRQTPYPLESLRRFL